MYYNHHYNGNILNRVVLIVNSNYAPLDICDTKRAICLWYLKKVDVIEAYEEMIHSPSLSIAAPSVVKLREYVHYQSLDVILSRKNLLIRDQHNCQYCGSHRGPLTIDHVIPKEKGGRDIWENLVVACIKCNLIKGNRTPEGAGMSLRKSPRKPNRIHHFQNFVRTPQGSWRPYLFMEAFETEPPAVESNY